MNNSLEIKQILYNKCVDFIEDRLKIINQSILEIQESLSTETKSSAGDKHETGRAMLQLEREKAGNQLAEILKIKKMLSKINTDKTSKSIGLGSVVYTTQANYYISISAGELKFESDSFYAISSNTPIGRLLMGETVGNSVKFREESFTIQTVL